MKKYQNILIAAVLVWILTMEQARAETNTPGTPRGIRNNNPGNIRISNNQWRGKIPVSQNTDGSFEQFESMEMGVRAAILNLRSYFDRGIDTIEGIIKKWAPPTENDTGAYVNYVERCSGVDRNKKLRFEPITISKILRCMFVMENGERFKHLLPTEQEIIKTWGTL